MYSTLTKQEWMDAFRLREEQLPDALFILGSWGAARGLTAFNDIADGVTPVHRLENVVLAEWGSRRIAFAVVYGAPKAADVCHIFCALGVRAIVQLGWYGGLQPDLHYRELLVPDAVTGRDGVSRRYAAGPAHPSPRLSQALTREAETRRFAHRTGTLVSTTHITAESRRGVSRWSREGFTGVDLETAATFAVASKSGREYAALLSLSDLVIEGHTFWQRPTDAQMPEEDDVRRQLEIALAAVYDQT